MGFAFYVRNPVLFTVVALTCLANEIWLACAISPRNNATPNDEKTQREKTKRRHEKHITNAMTKQGTPKYEQLKFQTAVLLGIVSSFRVEISSFRMAGGVF